MLIRFFVKLHKFTCTYNVTFLETIVCSFCLSPVVAFLSIFFTMNKPKIYRILIIQTAFLGDVVLATALIEKLRKQFPESRLDFVLRKSNESLLANHPYLNKVYVWNKQENKIKNLYKLVQEVRERKYDIVINLQRFFSSGLIAAFSGAKQIIGFKNNPLSSFFTHSLVHAIGDNTHEVMRNQSLITHLTDNEPCKPKLYPTVAQEEKVKIYQQTPYICLAPTSVWFTKQYPITKWVELLDKLPKYFTVYLLGSPADLKLCDEIIAQSQQNQSVINLCGKLSLLESASLMQKAVMNYVNDSAPLHLASAVNAPVCAIFCSTVPSFGFTPLSDKSFVVEIEENLPCRPCGLHGYKQCPKQHFKCGYEIKTEKLLEVLN